MQQKETIIIGNNEIGEQFGHWNYEEYGIKGVGKNHLPIISMDKYINHDQDKELHFECLKGLALTGMEQYKIAAFYGAIPPEEVQRLNGADGWTQMLKDLDKYDPDGLHRKNIEEIIATSDPNRQSMICKYLYYTGAAIPWFFSCYLKTNDFATKTKDLGDWSPAAKNFPKVMEYVKTLPFKEIGRVLFFTSYPGAGVTIHRDAMVREHKDHNINLFFDSGWRPSFIWDEVKKEKVYLPQGSKSYFFNNRDYHGVDPEPVFKYTLRVDGVFTDELCEDLGLVDGYTWHPDYGN